MYRELYVYNSIAPYLELIEPYPFISISRESLLTQLTLPSSELERTLSFLKDNELPYGYVDKEGYKANSDDTKAYEHTIPLILQLRPDKEYPHLELLLELQDNTHDTIS